jgi:hypothetical protein
MQRLGIPEHPWEAGLHGKNSAHVATAISSKITASDCIHVRIINPILDDSTVPILVILPSISLRRRYYTTASITDISKLALDLLLGVEPELLLSVDDCAEFHLVLLAAGYLDASSLGCCCSTPSMAFLARPVWCGCVGSRC